MTPQILNIVTLVGWHSFYNSYHVENTLSQKWGGAQGQLGYRKDWIDLGLSTVPDQNFANVAEIDSLICLCIALTCLRQCLPAFHWEAWFDWGRMCQNTATTPAEDWVQSTLRKIITSEKNEKWFWSSTDENCGCICQVWELCKCIFQVWVCFSSLSLVWQ